MSKIKRKHSKEFKFKVALESIKEQKTISKICQEFAVCDSQVNAWKKQLKDNGSIIFEDNSLSSKLNAQADLEAKIKELNEYIGELSVENKFFKKKLNF
jgi:transposase-like protein